MAVCSPLLVKLFWTLAIIGVTAASLIAFRESTEGHHTLVSTAKAWDPNCTEPATSSDPEQWSTRDFIDKTLPKIISPTPIFWSGNHSGKSVQIAATKCSIIVDGTTSNQLMCNEKETPFIMPANGSGPEGSELWHYTSKIFAKRTSGKAYVVIDDAFVSGVWATLEYPTLRNNKNVTAIIQLDPDSCEETCSWYCRDMKSCKGLSPCKFHVQAA